MGSKRESRDAETIHSFIHSPAPAHFFFLYGGDHGVGSESARGDRGRIWSIDDRLARRYRVPTATQTDRPNR
jgi:hypothetical protein